ncbi:uncharacterized protein LOC110735896 [Chenopodium quinoa]|uniref:uncharacterized protein LOC110718934 n=1 Tax=Chenopodium quinoa TaxID=63459 RepID=UPI000B7934E1|nr:uncharacterized protein LOC110718934 [Chenopodium quinoa]XP_021771766.1 uncharacterized protein LOC110735896 [Chenopodium quinoa]
MSREYDEFDYERQSNFDTVSSQAASVSVDDASNTGTINPSVNKRQRTAGIWKHYTFFVKTIGNENVDYARCNLCGKEYKAPGKAGTSTCKSERNFKKNKT